MPNQMSDNAEGPPKNSSSMGDLAPYPLLSPQEAAWDEARLVLDAVSDTAHSVDKLCEHLSHITMTRTQYPKMESSLRDLIANIDDLQYYSDSMALSYGIAPSQLATSARSTAALERVLAIPELVEQILLHLSPWMVLKAQSANHAFHGAVLTSPQLQIHLGLRAAAANAHITTPPLDDFSLHQLILSASSGLAAWQESWSKCHYIVAETVHSYKQRVKGRRSLLIKISFKSGEALPVLGARYRSMLICNPPVTQVAVTRRCCRPSDLNPMEPRTSPDADLFQSQTGFTLGDILDLTKEQREKHSNCPIPPTEGHDADGNVLVDPIILAVVALRDNDPVAVALKTAEQSRLDRMESERKVRERLDAFVQQKRAARRERRPIPTFAEFEALAKETETKASGEQADS